MGLNQVQDKSFVNFLDLAMLNIHRHVLRVFLSEKKFWQALRFETFFAFLVQFSVAEDHSVFQLDHKRVLLVLGSDTLILELLVSKFEI